MVVRRPGALLLSIVALAAGAFAQAPAKTQAPETAPPSSMQPSIARCELTDTVDSGSAAYLIECVDRAGQLELDALVVRVDTPGGSLEATRQIVQRFLASEVPIVVWVGPAGARAGSAGVFITMAAHVAGMAPGTNIGAAHPVMGPGGADPEQAGEHMAAKVVNDTVAFAQSIAQQRGRNAEWAEQAVRESASVTAEKALDLHVIDLLATTEEALLEQIDGRTLKNMDGAPTLRTANPHVVDLEPSLRQRLVHWLSNPAVAYLLFLIGGLGIAIEFAHPGMIAPGVIGAVCLVLGMIAFSALPISTGAVILLVIGFALIVAELFVTSGVVGAAGVGLLVLGGVLLVDRFDPDWFVEPSFRLPLSLVLPTAVTLGGCLVFLVVRSAQTRTLPQLVGDVGLVDELGRSLTPIDARGGEVFVHGERWQAISAAPIPAGARVRIRRVENLVVHVEEEKS